MNPADDAQHAGILHISLDGGIAITNGAGSSKYESVSNSFAIQYPHTIVVPPKGVMVSEVSVTTIIYFVGGGLNTAAIRIDNNASFVECPFVVFDVIEDVITNGPPLP